MSINTGSFSNNDISYQSLESDQIRICVCPEKGGEVSSVQYKKLMDGRELLYRANDYTPIDPSAFQGRAPLMWPTVTRNYVKDIEPIIDIDDLPANSSYTYKDTVYYIPGRSGFAKDLPWELIHNTPEKGIRMGLNSSAKTRKWYPFDFTLTVDYSIKDNHIFMDYTITNLSAEKMFFSIANHIGFNIPFYEDSKREDLVIKTSGKYHRNYDSNWWLTDEYTPIPLMDGIRLGDNPGLYSMPTAGYDYENNYFQIIDKDLCYEIIQRIDRDASSGFTLPPEEEIYYRTWGGDDLGYICTEPWIGGCNSFNTKKGLIYLDPEGVLVWKLRVSMKQLN